MDGQICPKGHCFGITRLFLTLTILLLKEWSAKFIYLNCNLIKLILQIPMPPFGFTSFYFKRFVSSKIYDKRGDFDFDIVNFPFLDGDIPKSSFLWSIYLSTNKVCLSM